MKFNLEVTICKLSFLPQHEFYLGTIHSKIVIVVGALKGGRADWLVEKCTVCLYFFKSSCCPKRIYFI